MKHFDVFNGDADGICALHQLRLAKPLRSVLITGVKHDAALLGRVPLRRGISVTVLDISLYANRTALLALLAHGITVEYFDHHFAGAIPEHSHLNTHIETTPDTCTSMLVDRHLGGQHRLWAIVGAYGDNLAHAAQTLAGSRGLQRGQVEQLRELGESLNYNAYGESEADLLIPPARLYEMLRAYADPSSSWRTSRLRRRYATHDGTTWNWRWDCFPVQSSQVGRCMYCPMRHGLEGCGAFSQIFWQECHRIVLLPSLPCAFRATIR